MDNPKLQIYKTLKEKGLITKPNEEYEQMLKDEAKKGGFEKWKEALGEDKEKFEQMFEK